MLKIPRHLSPGAYQGPEERGERRRKGPGSPIREPGRGRASGRGGARGGGRPAGTWARGEAGPLFPLPDARAAGPPRPASSRGPAGEAPPGPGPPSLRALRPARRLPRLETRAEPRGCRAHPQGRSPPPGPPIAAAPPAPGPHAAPAGPPPAAGGPAGRRRRALRGGASCSVPRAGAPPVIHSLTHWFGEHAEHLLVPVPADQS